MGDLSDKKKNTCILLIVRNKKFYIERCTLDKFKQSKLYEKSVALEECVVFDRNPLVFSKILDLMQYGETDLSPNDRLVSLLTADLIFYGLPELLQCLSVKTWRHTEPSDLLQTSEADSTPVTSSVPGETSDVVESGHGPSCVPSPSSSRASGPRPVTNCGSQDEVIELNVGGVGYTTSRSTLTRYASSMLGTMFSGRIEPAALRDAAGRVFIDRDGRLFGHVINFLRTATLPLTPDSPEMDGLAVEADFYQIPELMEAVAELRRVRDQRDKVAGIYLEVKDSIICFRGFHITTSLVGPMAQLAKVSPFREEFERSGSTSHWSVGGPGAYSAGGGAGSGGVGGPSLWCSLNPYYTAWVKGGIEEVYLNSDSSISRLEWAVRLRRAGWHLVNTTSCCSSVSDQTYIVVDKWFLPSASVPAPSTPLVVPGGTEQQQGPALREVRSQHAQTLPDTLD